MAEGPGEVWAEALLCKEIHSICGCDGLAHICTARYAEVNMPYWWEQERDAAAREGKYYCGA